MNESSRRLSLFVKAIKDQHDDMKQLLAAMKDAGTTDALETFNDAGEYFTWQSFCDLHTMDGDRFKQLLEPLMDLKTPVALQNGELMPLRDFGGDGDNYLLKIDMLVGGEEKPPRLWVMCAMHLAQTPDFPVPSSMQANADAAESEMVHGESA